jgi:quercetin dioxygenase-like cupin family protein
MSAASPPVVPTEATFHHVEDIAWTPVQQQRNADGTVSVIRERWPIIRPGFLSAYVTYEQGMVVRRHGHRSNHIVIVIDGGASIGGEWCTAGAHFHVPLGAAFGPIVSGPEGVVCWELSFGEFGGWGDQPELYQQEIERLGVTPLPDPPLHIGDWFKDPRGDWGAERRSPKVEGLAERLIRYDTLPWTDVARQRNADGTIAAVRAQWAVTEPGFVSAHVAYDPGMVVRRHRRAGHHLLLVVAGGAWFGDRWCPTGTHIEVPAGAPLGPVVAGAEGARFLELVDGDQRSWGDDPDEHAALLAGRGVTALPDPPLDPGLGLVDTRGERGGPAAG